MSAVQSQLEAHNVASTAQLEGQRPGMVFQGVSRMERKKKIIRVLGISEVVIGSLCMLLGAIATGYSEHERSTYYSNGYAYRPYYSVYSDLNIGQAMWCGIWILIAGGLGIAAGGKRSTYCLINIHMGFAIVGAIAAGSLFIIDMLRIFIMASSIYNFLMGLVIPTVIASFISMVTLIISASYSCCINSGNCCVDCSGNCCDEPYQNERQQVFYVGNRPQLQQPPIVFQGVTTAMNQAGQYYVIQRVPGTQMLQQSIPPVQTVLTFGTTNTNATVVAQSQVNQPTPPTDQLDANQVQSKQQEAVNSFSLQSDNALKLPPDYSQE